jgi:hypothetical protein
MSHGDTQRAGWPVSSRSPAAVVQAAKASSAGTGGEVLTFIEAYNDDVASIPVVGGEPGVIDPGDAFLFEAPLMNRAGTRQLGKEYVRCENGFEGFTCEATMLIFNKGKITAAGTMFSADDTVLAVTGGTGKFKTAHGQLTSTLTDDGNDLLVIHVIY